jgi:hypothetical protein
MAEGKKAVLVITDPGMPPTVFVVPDEALNQDDIKRLNRLLEYIGSVDFDAEEFRECKNLKEVHDAVVMDMGLEDDDECPEFDWHPDQKLAVTRKEVKARKFLEQYGTVTGRLSSNHPGLANTPKSARQAAKIQDFGRYATGRFPSEPELQHINPSLQGKKYEKPAITFENNYSEIEKRLFEAIGRPIANIYDEFVFEVPEREMPKAREALRQYAEAMLKHVRVPLYKVGDLIVYHGGTGHLGSSKSSLQELPKKLKTPNGKEIERTWDPCCDGCLGWVHMSRPYEIETCDACARFKKEDGEFLDEQARKAHKEECGCGLPEFDFQDAAMAWVNDLEEGGAVNNLTQSDISELEGLLNVRGVEFMDNVTPAIYVCSRFIEKTKEGPDNNRLQRLMKLLKDVQDGISNETLKLKDFGDPPGAQEENH